MKNADNRLIGLESKSESHAQAVIEDIKAGVEEKLDEKGAKVD